MVARTGPSGAAFATDDDLRARWRAAATSAGLSATGGALSASAGMLRTVQDKQALRRASGAVAVDMESHAVAAVADAASVPFAAVRAIADPAHRPLPRAVIGIIRPDGLPDVDRLILRLCARPWEIPTLFRLRRDADAALASLGRLVRGFGAAGFL